MSFPIAPVYFVKHADGSFSVAEPQPVPAPIADLLGKPIIATGSHLQTVSVGDGSVVEECSHPL